MNIKVVTDTTGRVIPYNGEYGGRIIGEAREYVIRQADSLPPLGALCVEYRGAVPPFDSATADSDWKGRIVSMRGNFRASEQTRWYPTLFDSATAATADLVTYDLAVQCATCTAIYVNGAEPVADTIGRFASAVPRTLLIYAGNFAVHRAPAVTFLKGRADARTTAVFSDAIARVGNYFEGLLGIPYGERPVLLSFESVSRGFPNGQVRWQFVTWPTITFSGGLDFDRLVDTTGPAPRVPDGLWNSISHEMGHYYFGTVRMPHGPLLWFVLESTAEYLALKSTAAVRGDVVLANRLVGYSSAITSERFPALSAVTASDQLSSNFRYRLGPLLLLALDWQVGEAKVGGMLRALLRSSATESADYAAIRRAAAEAGITAKDFDGAMAMPSSELRRRVLDRAHTTLQTRSLAESSATIVQLANSLANADTTTTGRARALSALQAVTARDSTNLLAHFQIGRIGGDAGIELDAARRSLERYLRSPPPPGAPGLATATYRLGVVLERSGDRVGAAGAYRRALALDATLSAAKEALARVDSRK